MDVNKEHPGHSILRKAQEIIYGDREQTYGNPAKNLELIATYWTGHINAAKNTNISLTYDDVCTMMVLLKSARLSNTAGHLDSLIDICGYAALNERCQESFAEKRKSMQVSNEIYKEAVAVNAANTNSTPKEPDGYEEAKRIAASIFRYELTREAFDHHLKQGKIAVSR